MTRCRQPKVPRNANTIIAFVVSCGVLFGDRKKDLGYLNAMLNTVFERCVINTIVGLMSGQSQSLTSI